MWDRGADPQASDELRGRLKWFLLGRVAVISGFLVMVAIAYLRTARERFDVPVDELLLIVVATYAFSALSAMLLPHLRRPARLRLRADRLRRPAGHRRDLAHRRRRQPVRLSLQPADHQRRRAAVRGRRAFAAVCSALAYDGLLAALAGNAAGVLAQPELSDPHIGMRVASTNVTFGLIAFLSSILTRRLHAAERLLREKQAERDHLALLQDTLARTIGSGLITTDADGRITVDRRHAPSSWSAGRRRELIGDDIGAVFAPLRLTPSARLRFLQSSAPPSRSSSCSTGPDERRAATCAASARR